MAIIINLFILLGCFHPCPAILAFAMAAERPKDRASASASGRTGGLPADGQKLEDLSSRAHDDRLIPDLHGGIAHNAVHAAVEERLSGFGAARSR